MTSEAIAETARGSRADLLLDNEILWITRNNLSGTLSFARSTLHRTPPMLQEAWLHDKDAIRLMMDLHWRLPTRPSRRVYVCVLEHWQTLFPLLALYWLHIWTRPLDHCAESNEAAQPQS